MQKCIVVSMMKKENFLWIWYNVLTDLTTYLFLVMQQKALIKDVTNIKLLT